MKTFIDCTTDPECQRLLADLESLAQRAESLKKRLDNEHVAVGKAWGITRGLGIALQSARSEFTANTD